jgi:hypothetical protein
LEKQVQTLGATVQAPAPDASAPPASAHQPAPEATFAFADFTWLNGNARTKDPAFDSAFFTPEIRADISYIHASIFIAVAIMMAACANGNVVNRGAEAQRCHVSPSPKGSPEIYPGDQAYSGSHVLNDPLGPLNSKFSDT